MNTKSRRWAAALAVVGLGAGGLVAAGLPTATAATGEISRVTIGQYERDEVLEVDGQPFFFNGVQMRVDKNEAVFGPEYAYNSAKTRSLYKAAADMGFTTINVQVPWLKVQPDRSVAASDAAYVVRGMPDETFSGGNIQTAYDAASTSNQSLALLKFTIPSDYTHDLTASKVRVYVDNTGNPLGDGADLWRSHDLKVYSLPSDSWDDASVTWNSLGVSAYDGTNLSLDGVEQTPLDVTPSWDRIKKANYFDFDVTQFVTSRYGAGDRTVSLLLQSSTPVDAESEVPISIDGLNGTFPPELVLSSADPDNFDWSYLDEAMRNASNNNLKFEIIWFGGDTTSNSMDNRIPYYVFQDVAKTMTTPSCTSEPTFRAQMDDLKEAKLNACDPNHPAGAPLFKKRDAATSKMYGVYDFLLDKADPKLLQYETAALSKVMEHVAEWEETQNAGKHTTVGVQVANESMTLRMEGSGTINGTYMDVSQSDISLADWRDFEGFTWESTANDGRDTFKEFNRHVLWHYYNELSKVVKQSTYPVWTRANDSRRGYSAVEYNQRVRAAGGTSYLDFVGIDPYGASRDQQYRFGHSKIWNDVDYSYGNNLPMIMEIGAEDGQYAVSYGLLSTLSGGGYYNIYELCGADEHGIFNSPASKYGVGDCTYDGPFFDASGSTDTSAANRVKIDYLTGVNTMLKSIGHDLATKKPNGLGGGRLVFLNERHGAGSGHDVTTTLRSMDVTFRSQPLTIGSWSAETAGVAIERGPTEFAFANAGATATTFTLSGVAGNIASAQVGSYDDPATDATENAWIRETDATVTTSGSDATVTVPPFGVVRVVTWDPIPLGEQLVETEDITDYTLPSGAVRQVWDDGASGGGWVKVGAEGMTALPAGAEVTFRVYSAQARKTRIVTAYKATTGRATAQLSVNGQAYSTPVDMSVGSEFVETDPAETVTLQPGTNDLTFTVTEPGVLSFDYFRLDGSDDLVNEQFDSDAPAPAFGFSQDATISGGALRLTNGMSNYTTAIKQFPSDISGQLVTDVSFDWTYGGDRNSKGGIEFRDPDGKLVFAIQGSTKTSGPDELRYSTVGPDSDSSTAEFALEPEWSSVPIDQTKTYTVRFRADYANQTVSFRILDGSAVLVEEVDVPITATGLDRMVATSAYRENSNAQSVDNLVMTGSGDAP